MVVEEQFAEVKPNSSNESKADLKSNFSPSSKHNGEDNGDNGVQSEQTLFKTVSQPDEQATKSVANSHHHNAEELLVDFSDNTPSSEVALTITSATNGEHKHQEQPNSAPKSVAATEMELEKSANQQNGHNLKVDSPVESNLQPETVAPPTPVETVESDSKSVQEVVVDQSETKETAKPVDVSEPLVDFTETHKTSLLDQVLATEIVAPAQQTSQAEINLTDEDLSNEDVKSSADVEQVNLDDTKSSAENEEESAKESASMEHESKVGVTDTRQQEASVEQEKHVLFQEELIQIDDSSVKDVSQSVEAAKTDFDTAAVRTESVPSSSVVSVEEEEQVHQSEFVFLKEPNKTADASESNTGESKVEELVSEEPILVAKTHSESVSAEPTHVEPIHVETTPTETVLENEAHVEPTSEEIVQERPLSEEQVHIETATEKLTSAEPEHVESAHEEHSYGGKRQVESAVEQQVHVETSDLDFTTEEPVHVEFTCEKIADAEPTFVESDQAIPAHEENVHVELEHSESVHNEPVHVEPETAVCTESTQSNKATSIEVDEKEQLIETTESKKSVTERTEAAEFSTQESETESVTAIEPQLIETLETIVSEVLVTPTTHQEEKLVAGPFTLESVQEISEIFVKPHAEETTETKVVQEKTEPRFEEQKIVIPTESVPHLAEADDEEEEEVHERPISAQQVIPRDLKPESFVAQVEQIEQVTKVSKPEVFQLNSSDTNVESFETEQHEKPTARETVEVSVETQLTEQTSQEETLVAKVSLEQEADSDKQVEEPFKSVAPISVSPTLDVSDFEVVHKEEMVQEQSILKLQTALSQTAAAIETNEPTEQSKLEEERKHPEPPKTKSAQPEQNDETKKEKVVSVFTTNQEEPKTETAESATKCSKCVFCKIVAGEEEAVKLYEDDEIVVIPDHKPASRQHYLVISKKHIANVKCLKRGDRDFVIRMKQVGQQVLQKHFEGDVTKLDEQSRFGFHWPLFASVGHLHMHVIAPLSDLTWKSKLTFSNKSWWFVSFDSYLNWLSK